MVSREGQTEVVAVPEHRLGELYLTWHPQQNRSLCSILSSPRYCIRIVAPWFCSDKKQPISYLYLLYNTL